jgi:peptidoglycan/xylan/chitin deacetylase (PgdA/CDA1 family)
VGLRIRVSRQAGLLSLTLLALLSSLGFAWQGTRALAIGPRRPEAASPGLNPAQLSQPDVPANAKAASLADPDRQLVVLAYHEIAAPGQAISPDYAVSPAALAAQLDWLRQHGYQFVSVNQALAARSGQAPLPRRPVLLSFDDGYASVYSQAFPLLKRFQAPALVAVVGRWLEPEQGKVSFGEGLIDRQQLLSWAQLREMQQSGLVEVASHSFDLHHGINGNPQGDQMPATTTRRYDRQGGYESEASYRQRLRDDLSRSASQLEQKLGRRPRVIVWPYGRYNAIAASVAREQGLPIGLTLDDGANNGSVPLGALRRVLMTAEMGPLAGLRQELDARRRNLGDSSRSASVMHVDLDYIDDPAPAQVERAWASTPCSCRPTPTPMATALPMPCISPTACCRSNATCSATWPGRSAAALRCVASTPGCRCWPSSCRTALPAPIRRC